VNPRQNSVCNLAPLTGLISGIQFRVPGARPRADFPGVPFSGDSAARPRRSDETVGVIRGGGYPSWQSLEHVGRSKREVIAGLGPRGATARVRRFRRPLHNGLSNNQPFDQRSVLAI
jgi:hypothetical protein